MKIHVLICFLAISIVSFSQSKKITLVIDVGHGGTDHGFIAEDKNVLPEKDLNLLIANKLGSYIQQYLTNIDIIYTRTTDDFVSLDDRVYKANSINADYFISIHCNANDRRIVHGTESHVHTMDSKKAVELGHIIEKEFSTKAGRHSRGVKDGNDREHSLQVLKYTSMTSLLIECGFMTHPKEANYLNTTEGQEIIASAIFRGFRTFILQEHPTINFIKATATKPVAAKTDKNKKAENQSTKKTYSIQIMSSKEPIETSIPEFKKLEQDITRQKINTSSEYKYRYLVGSFDSKEAGVSVLKKIQANGFKDAIIIELD